ncbi:hypothetical protein [Caulobacter sp. 17J80-11]|nr:hypothetical protein [Caulobacter sp. 17J80-11]
MSYETMYEILILAVFGAFMGALAYARFVTQRPARKPREVSKR